VFLVFQIWSAAKLLRLPYALQLELKLTPNLYGSGARQDYATKPFQNDGLSSTRYREINGAK
jgi:hypothetical protein